MESLFIQILLKKFDPYDWFCGPGSHIAFLAVVYLAVLFIYCAIGVIIKHAIQVPGEFGYSN